VTGVKGFPAPESHTVLRSRGWNMSRISKVVWVFVMAGVAAVAAAETVYKWVDASGQVHYTDLPPNQDGAKLIGTYEQESGIVDEGDFADEAGGDDETDDASTPPSNEAVPPEPPVSQQAMAAAQADTAKAQAAQCKEAQERYKRYTESRRLFRDTPDGKREYLTDKELTEARARAKQTVIDYCS
jgi:uncharacterized protein DUF4124